MKQLPVVLAVSLVLGLSACSSTKLFSNTESGVTPSPVTAVKEQTAQLSTEFKREGIKVFYTWGGEVEHIEVKGFANVWQQQYEHVAELEAKEKLIKFLHGETVSSARKTAVIAKALEKAQDNTVNKFKGADGTIATTAEDLEADGPGQTNSAIRNASIHNAQTVTSTITVNASGKLTAVYKMRGETTNDGKMYVGTYAWSPKEQAAARNIVNLMFPAQK